MVKANDQSSNKYTYYVIDYMQRIEKHVWKFLKLAEFTATQLTEQLNGECIVLDKNTIKEGEVTGLPILSSDKNSKKTLITVLKTSVNAIVGLLSGKKRENTNNENYELFDTKDNRSIDEDDAEVTYAKYYAIKRINELELYYYHKLLEKPERLPEETDELYEKRTKRYGGGMLNGKLKIKKDGLIYFNNKCLVPEEKRKKYLSKESTILNGEEIAVKLLNEIPGELRLELISSGDIKPVIMFIDELNRGSQEVMQELMNILLNRKVNGYSLPWFVQIASAINPADEDGKYATIEFDNAHKDRLLIIDTYADIQEFASYAAEAKLDNRYIAALMANPKQFADSYTVNDDDYVLSPRAHTMIATLFKYKNAFNKYNFFDSSELVEETINNDIEYLARAKIGQTAANAILLAMKNLEGMIDVYNEILNVKIISKETLYKFDKNNESHTDSYINYCLASLLEILYNEQEKYLKTKEDISNVIEKINAILNVCSSNVVYYYGKRFVSTKKYLKSGLYNKIYLTVVKTAAQSKKIDADISKINSEEINI